MTRLWTLSVAILVAAMPVAPRAARADDTPKTDAPKADAPKADAPKADAPKADAPKADAPKADAPKADAPKADETKAPAQGSLSVSSTPMGRVFIDGTDTMLSTPVVDLPVAPGKHTLKVVAADGREQTSEFEIEAGGSLNLNLNLPEAPAKVEEKKVDEKKVDEKKPDAVKTAEPPAATTEAPAPWTWMTVAGWTGLGLGTIGLLSGAVVLTTPTDPDQGPLGFGLFGAGVGLVIGGGVLLYLDTELADAGAATAAPAASKPDAKSDAKPDAKSEKAEPKTPDDG